MNEEIKTLYKFIQDKNGFKDRLSEKLSITKDAVEHNIAKNGHFKEKHLEIVLHWIKEQIQIDKEIKEMIVARWVVL